MVTVILTELLEDSKFLWEWTCPECGKIHQINFDSLIVQCKRCGEIYNTDLNMKDLPRQIDYFL